jgi:hypothetical protein
MVIAMNTSFYFINLFSMTLSWETIGPQDFTGKVVYSNDHGRSWQAFGDVFNLSNDTSPKSLTFDFNDNYRFIQLGFYFSLNQLNKTFNVKNPVISINYSQFSDQNAAESLKNQVILFTPCPDDEDDLVLINSNQKSDLIKQYNALTNNAKSLFAGLSIGGGFTALDRYLFLTR